MWMNLESVTQSEVSQKKKNKYHKLMHKYGIQKNDIDESICMEGMEKQMQRTDLWTQQGKERVGHTLREKNSTDMYTLLC